ERKAAREWARRSTDRAVLKLSQEVRRLRGLVSVAEEALDAVAGCSEVAQRMRAVLPVLQAKLEGRAPTWLEVLRRNVAMHADASDIDVSIAGAAALRKAQHGQRLEVRITQEMETPEVKESVLSAAAEPFVPCAYFECDFHDGDFPVQEQVAADGSEKLREEPVLELMALPQEQVFPALTGHDTEDLESLSVVQRRLANLVIESWRRAKDILDSLRAGRCPICLVSDLRLRSAPRGGVACELCHDSIHHTDKMVRCEGCQGAVHRACLQEQLDR
ncbi:unnamed protein product, partial [Prorocentrum cordatum]